MLMKEIKSLNKQRDTLCSWSRKLYTVKISMLPKLCLTQFLSKCHNDHFVDADRKIFKYIWKDKGTRITKIIGKKKNKVEESST